MNKRTLAITIFVSCLLAAGILVIAAGAVLVRYSPYGDPGALDTGVCLVLAALAFAAMAAGILLVKVVFPMLRGYFAWKRSLPPDQRFMMTMAETAAMELAHEEFRHHHQEVQERLTASVMGDAGPRNPWA